MVLYSSCLRRFNLAWATSHSISNQRYDSHNWITELWNGLGWKWPQRSSTSSHPMGTDTSCWTSLLKAPSSLPLKAALLGSLHNYSGQPIPVPHHPHRGEFPPNVPSQSSFFQFEAITPQPDTLHTFGERPFNINQIWYFEGSEGGGKGKKSQWLLWSFYKLYYYYFTVSF